MARTPMARSGGQPTAALAVTCTSSPVRHGFIMTRRSCCVHNPKTPSCFHRLRISLFSSSTRSSFPCLKAVVSYKSGRICAQLPFSVPQFNLCQSLYSLLPPIFNRLCISLYFPLTLSSIMASFRRPFHRYINDLSCAVDPVMPFIKSYIANSNVAPLG